jgi:hypothetical protein
MTAEWKGKIQIDGAKEAARDVEHVGRAVADGSRQFKGFAQAAGGLMTVLVSSKAVMQGDATALISLASGASLAWRAVSNLHPALRVLAIAGTGIIAIWPKISQYFETSAQRAERLKKAFDEAGLASSGLDRARDRASRLEAALDRQVKAANRAADAWHDMKVAAAEYESAARSAASARIDAQLIQDLENAGDSPRARAGAQATADYARAQLEYEASIAPSQQRVSAATAAQTRAQGEREAAGAGLGSARGVTAAARSEYEAALFAITPYASSEADIQAGRNINPRDDASLGAYMSQMGADAMGKEKREAFAKARDNLIRAMNDEEKARDEESAASADLTKATALLASERETAAEIEKAAGLEQANKVAAADAKLRMAEKEGQRELEQAEKERADYEFSKLSPKEQRRQLDEKIAQKEKQLADMGDSGSVDPSKKAQAIRDLTALKQQRDALQNPRAAQEGFDAFLEETGGRRGQRKMSSTDAAIAFRSRLGPSFSDKLMDSQFSRPGFTPKKMTAEERLAELQTEANGHLQKIEQRLENLGMRT